MCILSHGKILSYRGTITPTEKAEGRSHLPQGPVVKA